MKETEELVLEYVEPVLRFCLKRVANRQDAEDLSQEILIHILNGLQKYNIRNVEGWVWQIAHNRYARFVSSQVIMTELTDEDTSSDYDFVEQLIVLEEHQIVFQALHTLSSLYRSILVDYYVYDQSVQEIAMYNNIPQTTVKWRLYVGREKIKERMGTMPKVYSRINWNTTTCNGNLDTNRYLYSQLARAICLATYSKPLTIDEISLATGLPTLFIEDELPRLMYGEAIIQNGYKYSNNFIILSLKDNQELKKKFAAYSQKLVDTLTLALEDTRMAVKDIGFYGCDWGIKKLAYIIVPLIMRKAVYNTQQSNAKLKYGPFPPRKDGGYGWFIVSETEDDDEKINPSASGNNIYRDPNQPEKGSLYYLWLGRYFDLELYREGLKWVFQNNIIGRIADGNQITKIIPEDDLARLIRLNLIKRENKIYRLAIPTFTKEEFTALTKLYTPIINRLENNLNNLVLEIWEEFQVIVPHHLHDQINQYMAGYVHKIISLTMYEMINSGTIETPPKEGPLAYNVFYVNQILDEEV